MKTLITIFSLLFMVGCQGGKPFEEPGDESDKIPITICSSLTDLTKVTNNAYESGDRLGVYVVNQTSEQEDGTLENQGNHVDNMDFAYSGSGWTPGEDIFWQDNTTKAEFYCYQPFVSGTLNVLAHEFSVQANQNAGDGYKKSDFTWGKTSALAPTQGAVAIQTKHILSNVLISIKAGSGFTAEQIEGFTKSVTLIVKPSCVINLSTGEVNSSSNAVGVLAKQQGELFSVIVPPQTVSESDVCLKIVLNGQTFELSKGVTFAAGKQHRLTATLNESGSGSIDVGLSDWETGDQITIEGGAKRVAHAGGVIQVKVTSNVGYDVEIAEPSRSWITQLSTKNPTTRTLTFQVEPNTEAESRQGEIVLRNSADGSVIETVLVQQSSLLATSVHVDLPGTLGYLVEADVAATLTKLTVSGNIVADDFYFIRDAMPELEVLDISQTNVNRIPDNAFFGHLSTNTSYAFTKLKTLKLPDNIISVGGVSFSCLQQFETFDISNVVVVGNGAFSNCRSLKSIDFNPNLRVLSTSAFSDCTSLASIHIPEAIKVVGFYTFQNCRALKSVTFAPQSKLTKIDMQAFNGCSSLETIEIPVGVTSITIQAFQNCRALKSVTFAPQSKLTKIDMQAFYGCSSLETIEIPVGVTSIANYAFQYCTSLNTVTCYAVTPPTISVDVFDRTPTTKILKVPAESVSAYKADSYWSAAFNKGGNIEAL